MEPKASPDLTQTGREASLFQTILEGGDAQAQPCPHLQAPLPFLYLPFCPPALQNYLPCCFLPPDLLPLQKTPAFTLPPLTG